MKQKPFRIKEAFYSLQGEGARAGRPAVFCRFSKCNLWNGRESNRATSICNFCDTDFIGTDGQNGGIFHTSPELAQHLLGLWPKNPDGAPLGTPYIVCTGGEPALQLTAELVQCLQEHGFEVAIETNGTLPIPTNLNWVCLSPKGVAPITLTQCDELKLVFPQPDCRPEQFEAFKAKFFYLSPMASPRPTEKDLLKVANTEQALNYCLAHPQWSLSLQLHKLLDID